MAKKSKFDYFDAFEKQAEVAAEEADILIEAIENFTNAEDLKGILEKAHAIEHQGDDINHEILTSVSVDVITPIERADISDLAQKLDDVHFMHPRAIEFAQIIKKSLKALRKSMDAFREFKKVKKIRAMVEDVKEQEELADALYLETIRELYTVDVDNAVRVEVWSRLFDRFEATCDACEAVADTMANIVLKNV